MYDRVVKRIIDVIISLALAPVLVLMTLVCSIAIKMDDGGPVFYKARRIGRDGRIFNMYKFRSMKIDAPDLRLPDGSTFNSEDDCRVTRFGRIARKTSVDELPQLLNVLKGDMSLVGPRPDSAFYLDCYTPEERCILKVRPGITGYNQVVNRNAVGTKEKLAFDIYYVENQSFILDCCIVFRTIALILKPKNIFRRLGND